MCHVTQSICLHFCSHLFVGPGSALYVTTDQGPSSLSLAEVSTLSWNAGRLVSFYPERNLILFVSQVQYTDILNCNFSGSLLCQCQTPSAVLRNVSKLGTPAMHSFLTGSTKFYSLRQNDGILKTTSTMSVGREAQQCHLGRAFPPCNESEPTTKVFLLKSASPLPCFGDAFSLPQ